MYKTLRFLARIKNINKKYQFFLDKKNYTKISISQTCHIFYIHPGFVPTPPSDIIPNTFLFYIGIDTLVISDVDIIFNIEQYSDTELLLIFGKKFTDESLFGEEHDKITEFLYGILDI